MADLMAVISMTPWETRIRELVFVANPDECALTNNSRADNIILSGFIAWDTKTFMRDDYVYVVFGEQNPQSRFHIPSAATQQERAAQVSDWTDVCDAAFAIQPPLPPAGLFIQV